MQLIVSDAAPTANNVNPNIHGRIFRTSTFLADAVLFDMVRTPIIHARIVTLIPHMRDSQDGTLTDSIAAVEAAWCRVARKIGADPAFVIAATHGKRAIDNLARFKPHLRPDELSAAVDEFERSILFYADAYANARAYSRAAVGAGVRSAGSSTPSLLSYDGSSSSSGSSAGTSGVSSLVQSAAASTDRLVVVSEPQAELADELATALSAAVVVEKGCVTPREGEDESEWEWELEAAEVDRAVRILPGVKDLIASIPEGRYAVATSGAKTYGAASSPTVTFATELG
jgi:hypothetical protein